MEKYSLNTYKLFRSITVYNINGTPHEAGQISEVIDIVL